MIIICQLKIKIKNSMTFPAEIKTLHFRAGRVVQMIRALA
jgi:hypothetical protein